ncbi:hypothetical protein EV424DRAFT_1340879 [Suillus variegatus]|nr:hypothetical protein EV424DRAFT_1340879 [Suillus variegatus]
MPPAQTSKNQSFRALLRGEKLWSTCQTKWANLKTLYYVVLEIKNTSGFSWSDMDGAGITLEYESTWGSFVQSHKAAKLFKNKGFPHFKIIHQMMPRKSRGNWVHRNRPPNTSSEDSESISLPPVMSHSAPPTTIAASSIDLPPAQSLTALNLSQLTVAANEIIPSNTGSRCYSFQPGIVPPSPAAPSTYLASDMDAGSAAVSSVLTSVSRQDKRKISALGSDISVTSSSKRARPPSVAVKAQQEGNNTITSLADVLKDFGKMLADTTAATAANDLTHAVSMVSQSTMFSDDDKMDLIDYLGLNEREVVRYLNMDEKLRVVWVQQCLANIHARST